jgi:cellulose synthase/poly-beta-1,6-N-acetylglucosamine synthase-like glycosyltransferase
MQTFLVVAFGLVTGAGVVYVAFELRLLLGYWRAREWNSLASTVRSGGTGVTPHVVVQIPIFNEGAVAIDVIKAVCALDFPRERLQIQILDDSVDETPDLIAPLIAQKSAQGIDIQHLRRSQREGWKAGALAWGLAQSDAEFVAIFDADFLPPSDFLRRALIDGNAFADPDVAFLQGRWTYTNAVQNLLTRAQAILLDRHFAVQKPYQSTYDRTIAFNGSVAIWRRSAIEKAGGWSADTLCEDLDLSYRCALAGLKGRYDFSLACPSELPPSILAFKLQQRRWAQGTAQCLQKLSAEVLRSRRIHHRWEDIHAMAGYIIHPILLAYCLLWPWVVLKGLPTPILVVSQACMMVANLTAIVGFIFAAFASGRVVGISMFKDVSAALILGMALMVNSSVAFFIGCFERKSAFERTPKQGTISNGTGPQSPRVKLHWTIYLEIALLAYMLCLSARLVEVQEASKATPCLLMVASMGFAVVSQVVERFLPRARLARGRSLMLGSAEMPAAPAGSLSYEEAIGDGSQAMARGSAI